MRRPPRRRIRCRWRTRSSSSRGSPRASCTCEDEEAAVMAAPVAVAAALVISEVAVQVAVAVAVGRAGLSAPPRVLFALHNRHDRAPLEAREEGAKLGVGAQRQVGVAQVDEVLKVQPAPQHRRHCVKERQDHRPAGPKHRPRPAQHVHVGPWLDQHVAQLVLARLAQLRVDVHEEDVRVVRAHVLEGTRPLQRHHVPVDRLPAVGPAGHDEIDEANDAAGRIRQRQRPQRVNVQLWQSTLSLHPLLERRSALAGELRLGRAAATGRPVQEAHVREGRFCHQRVHV